MADQDSVRLPPGVIRSPIQDPLGRVSGSTERHDVRWPGLGQRVEIIFAETKNDWGESSQSFLGNTGLRCPAVIKKCKKVKNRSKCILVSQGYKKGHSYIWNPQIGCLKMWNFNCSDLIR